MGEMVGKSSGNNYVDGQWAAGNAPMYYVMSPKDVIIAKPRKIILITVIFVEVLYFNYSALLILRMDAEDRISLASSTRESRESGGLLLEELGKSLGTCLKKSNYLLKRLDAVPWPLQLI
ncbi:uncharacterized protein LOC113281653 isoform X1 [Papaver somniferum]|uniref:uncharacterized protein LOC113281653 isoform X1 n=1 Tax=Papaver somniferum TaxID=3469 RepID=UPI000E6FC097|nr:uncharacterized protein LOC113281653 isoform X1 [Papaver somniferum]